MEPYSSSLSLTTPVTALSTQTSRQRNSKGLVQNADDNVVELEGLCTNIQFARGVSSNLSLRAYAQTISVQLQQLRQGGASAIELYSFAASALPQLKSMVATLEVTSATFQQQSASFMSEAQQLSAILCNKDCSRMYMQRTPNPYSFKTLNRSAGIPDEAKAGNSSSNCSTCAPKATALEMAMRDPSWTARKDMQDSKIAVAQMGGIIAHGVEVAVKESVELLSSCFAAVDDQLPPHFPCKKENPISSDNVIIAPSCVPNQTHALEDNQKSPHDFYDAVVFKQMAAIDLQGNNNGYNSGYNNAANLGDHNIFNTAIGAAAGAGTGAFAGWATQGLSLEIAKLQHTIALNSSVAAGESLDLAKDALRKACLTGKSPAIIAHLEYEVAQKAALRESSLKASESAMTKVFSKVTTSAKVPKMLLGVIGGAAVGGAAGAVIGAIATGISSDPVQ